MNIFSQIKLLSVALSIPLLTGCLSDYVPPSPKEEQQKLKDEAIAAGSACRQAGRSIESCFDRYESLERSGIFLGWKEMDDYMRTNSISAQKMESEEEEKKATADASNNGKKVTPEKSASSLPGTKGGTAGSSDARGGVSARDLNPSPIDLSSQELKEQVNQALNKK